MTNINNTMPAEKLVEKEKDSSNTEEKNPYLSIIQKKHRSIKKKLEKIKQLEERGPGKPLNEEQQVLISSKAGVERSLVELDAVKVLLEEVAKEEGLKEAKEAILATPVPIVSIPTPSPEPVIVPVVQKVTEASPAEIMKLLEIPLKKVLKALHVHARYELKTGKPLPVTVDFFGKALLGMTSIRPFPDTLDASLRSAGLYLHDDLAVSSEAVLGLSYHDMSVLIDGLAKEMEMQGTGNAPPPPPPPPVVSSVPVVAAATATTAVAPIAASSSSSLAMTGSVMSTDVMSSNNNNVGCVMVGDVAVTMDVSGIHTTGIVSTGSSVEEPTADDGMSEECDEAEEWDEDGKPIKKGDRLGQGQRRSRRGGKGRRGRKNEGMDEEKDGMMNPTPLTVQPVVAPVVISTPTPTAPVAGTPSTRTNAVPAGGVAKTNPPPAVNANKPPIAPKPTATSTTQPPSNNNTKKASVPHTPTPKPPSSHNTTPSQGHAVEFDENIYTKKLDLSRFTREQIEEAERLAREIEDKANRERSERERGERSGGKDRSNNNNNNNGGSGVKPTVSRPSSNPPVGNSGNNANGRTSNGNPAPVSSVGKNEGKDNNNNNNNRSRPVPPRNNNNDGNNNNKPVAAPTNTTTTSTNNNNRVSNNNPSRPPPAKPVTAPSTGPNANTTPSNMAGTSSRPTNNNSNNTNQNNNHNANHNNNNNKVSINNNANHQQQNVPPSSNNNNNNNQNANHNSNNNNNNNNNKSVKPMANKTSTVNNPPATSRPNPTPASRGQ